MPSDRNTAYPFLEQMRTEELEALLQQEFTAADGGEPDVDYIIAIMEVMKQRDANPRRRRSTWTPHGGISRKIIKDRLLPMRLRSSRNVTHPILTKSPPLPPKRKAAGFCGQPSSRPRAL